MTAHLYYAHPDGYLRLVGSGDLGAAWSSNPVLDATQRAALRTACDAAGQLTYVPSAATTGLLPGTTLESLVPLGSGTTLSAGTWGTTPLTGRIVWGQLAASTSGASSVSNSALAGPRPDLVAANPNSQAVIRETSNSARVWSMQHCVVDPLLWCIPELDPPGGAWDIEETLFLIKGSIGLRGGRWRILHSELRNVQDPMNIAVTLTDLATDELVTGGGAYLRHSWVHTALYYRGPLYPAQPEGTHSDLCQWSRPQYMDFAYNLFGGPRSDLSGYARTPSMESSDGAHNAGMMAQQEKPTSDLGMIRNVTVRRNLFWLHGPASGEANGYNVNHYYKTAYPNAMSTVAFTDNLHVQRADGRYVIRSDQYAGLHSGHKIVQMASDGRSWTVLGNVTPARG